MSSRARIRPALGAALAVGAMLALAVAHGLAQAPAVFRPELAVPESLQPFLEDVQPGADEFPEEGVAAAIESRLHEFGARIRADPRAAPAAATALLDRDFHGAALLPAGWKLTSAAPFEVRRAEVNDGAAPALDARGFAPEIGRLLAGMTTIDVAEFLITSIEPAGDGLVRTAVRYDVVGRGPEAWRLEHVGSWTLTWHTGSPPRIVRWTPASLVTSRARTPVFVEISQAALGGNESFRRQLSTGLDAWMATIDAVLTRDTNGHHGVSVGDAEGDGLEDLYVAQPAGLPNRLFRARGDSTFEDVTDQAGVGVLDDTAQSIFADVDNDGDQDLLLTTGTKPLLFVNDGHGRFAPAADAFRLAEPLQGVLTSMAVADYDRDGFLDVYVCVYSYFYGAGEDKAGTPMPYYDARNGPPGVLFRNDGHGRFVDVTAASGLSAGNDRYHFAASWADYDGDGWQDLLVANDFGTKNLYHNLGARGGTVRFEDVAAAAGVSDYGAGMSAAFLDYDNDGRLDIYTGNMWSASGQRVTASPAFMPDAPADVRALYHRHARGNSLFRNRGDGTFDDATLGAHAGMGRWAWSSDALDFDNDGWQDLYVVNGMLTRPGDDLEGFFWRQVVARSPLVRAKDNRYDEAWRAINQLLVKDSIAAHQRNVFLRNDGHGGFDDVSGAVGLDFDQDGRSFATLDLDGDGDSDLVVMAARDTPQLRVFRNDLARPTALAVRLTGRTSNRDAIGARVQLDTVDASGRAGTLVRIVQAGSGFISQRSRELLFGLGGGARATRMSVTWPSGSTQVFEDLPASGRLRLEEGSRLQVEPFAAPAAPLGTDVAAPRAVPAPDASWLFEPVPAPAFTLPDQSGTSRSPGNRGRPAVILLWSPRVEASRAALEALAAGAPRLARAGVDALGLTMEDAQTGTSVRLPPAATLPVVQASKPVAIGYALLYRHLFMNRQDLPLPTALLLDASGAVVKVYRGGLDPAVVARDAATAGADQSPAQRLSRAVPFAGTFYAPPARRNYLPYGHDLLDQGLENAAIDAFERAAAADPSAPVLYRLGSLLSTAGRPEQARAALERALTLQPDLAEASNDLGALLAREGRLEEAIARFRGAIAAEPDYPDALNNLGYALLLTGHPDEARTLYEKALALQPDFPDALNNLGMLLGQAGQLDRAEGYFRDALKRRAGYGEAANNLALVLVARGRPEAAITLLESFRQATPQYEGTYVTLAKIYFTTGHRAEAIASLQALLARHPSHPLAIELLRSWTAQ
jgi:Flp pilus assembly protein TadD